MADHTDKKKRRKRPSKADAKLSSAKLSKPPKVQQPGPLVSPRTIHSLFREQSAEMESVVGMNPLSRALNAIQMAVMQDPTADRPKALNKIGRHLRSIAPEGYELDWLPPLSAEQIKIILCDEASVDFIKATYPGRLGAKTINSLLLIAGLLLASE